jgi:hypothetical protein
MRPLASISVLLMLVMLLMSRTALYAQEQERKLMDRIMTPDMSLGYSMQGKAFYGGGSGSYGGTKDANVKDFYFVQKFTAKSFDAKDYDAKSFWQGNFQFATKGADVKSHPAADKAFDTKSAPVKEANDAGKGYGTADHGYATHENEAKGKTSQNHLDEVYKGDRRMNIDEVRDLLNKPPL